jgi:uncharacterized repeat protein (TIGR01451 family)
LMTYALSDGESNHSPGPIASAILQDVGWTFEGYPDVSIVKEVVGGQGLEPGDPITFTLTIANGGQEEASNVVVTDTMPDEVLNPTYDRTLTVTSVGDAPYLWNIEPLGVGESGVITIYGQIDPGLDSNFSFVNSATISDPQDVTPGNNTSGVTVGGSRVYMPLIARRWPPIPDTPVLNAISNSDGDENYTVNWGAADLADTYTLWEDDNAAFSSPETRYTGSGTSWSASDKAAGTYYYQVRANNSWGSSGWSNVRSVSVTSQPSGPNPGFWESATEPVEFYVTSDRAYVDDFAIYINVSDCGSYKITHTRPESISNDQFSFTGSYYASGRFSDATHSSGQVGLDYYYIEDCGYISGGPWPWSTTWQHSSQSTSMPFEVVEAETVEPTAATGRVYTATLVE